MSHAQSFEYPFERRKGLETGSRKGLAIAERPWYEEDVGEWYLGTDHFVDILFVQRGTILRSCFDTNGLVGRAIDAVRAKSLLGLSTSTENYILLLSVYGDLESTRRDPGMENQAHPKEEMTSQSWAVPFSHRSLR